MKLTVSKRPAAATYTSGTSSNFRRDTVTRFCRSFHTVTSHSAKTTRFVASFFLTNSSATGVRRRSAIITRLPFEKAISEKLKPIPNSFCLLVVYRRTVVWTVVLEIKYLNPHQLPPQSYSREENRRLSFWAYLFKIVIISDSVWERGVNDSSNLSVLLSRWKQVDVS